MKLWLSVFSMLGLFALIACTGSEPTTEGGNTGSAATETINISVPMT